MSKPRERLHESLGGYSEGLPGGWIRAKLPDVAIINMGQSPPGKSYNTEGAGLPFFQGKADFGERYPSVRVWCSDPRKVAHAGDVLLSVRAPVGPTNLADRTCAIGRGLAAISPKNGTTSEYIYFAIRRLEQELSLRGTGSTFTAIRKRDIEEIEIDLPPLDEQKRIVAKIEELLPRVNAVRERLIRVKVLMKRFRQSVLSGAFTGKLTARFKEEDKQRKIPSPPNLPLAWISTEQN
jgi:type I restriction enzyme, S subunit